MEHKTYHDPQKWDNICATFKRYYKNQTKFKLDPEQKASYQFTDEPEIRELVCCDGKISSPIISAPIKQDCGDHEHEGLLYVCTNNCLGTPVEEQGKLQMNVTLDDDEIDENGYFQPDASLLAIWEAAVPVNK